MHTLTVPKFAYNGLCFFPPRPQNSPLRTLASPLSTLIVPSMLLISYIRFQMISLSPFGTDSLRHYLKTYQIMSISNKWPLTLQSIVCLFFSAETEWFISSTFEFPNKNGNCERCQKFWLISTISAHVHIHSWTNHLWSIITAQEMSLKSLEWLYLLRTGLLVQKKS